MKRKFGREIGLLMLPILVIGGVGWWANRNGPPVDLKSGAARLVTRVRVVDLTPFDHYRGLTHRIEIDNWAAGKLPPAPLPRAGATRSYRQNTPHYSPLYVAFRQGKIWRRTLSINEATSDNRDRTLKSAGVKPNVASLWLESGGGALDERQKFTANYGLRLPTSPRVDEIVLRGRTRAELQDRDTRIIGGIPTGTASQTSFLLSEPIREVLRAESPAQIQSASGGNAALVRVADWTVAEVAVLPPVVGMGGGLSVDVVLRAASGARQASRIRLIKARLLDANGRKVADLNSYSNGGRAHIMGDLPMSVNFDVPTPRWPALVKPLTFQGIISVDGAWPEEVNAKLGTANKVLPVKKSKLRFIREPLPLR